jgi:hypothetical protein
MVCGFIAVTFPQRLISGLCIILKNNSKNKTINHVCDFFFRTVLVTFSPAEKFSIFVMYYREARPLAMDVCFISRRQFPTLLLYTSQDLGHAPSSGSVQDHTNLALKV